MSGPKLPEWPEEDFGIRFLTTDLRTEPLRLARSARYDLPAFVAQVLERLSNGVSVETEAGEPWYATVEGAEWGEGSHISCKFLVTRSPRATPPMELIGNSLVSVARRDDRAEAVYDYGGERPARADEFTLYYTFAAALSLDLNFTLFEEFLTLQIKDLEHEPRSLEEQNQPG